MIVCISDLFLSQYLEKKHLFYPILKFTCFCGWNSDLSSPGLLFPNRTYRFNQVRKHTKGCLNWILNADFNGLTPYFAHSYAKDLGRSARSSDTFHLKMAKRYSRRVREGKDPFGASVGDLDELVE